MTARSLVPFLAAWGLGLAVLVGVHLVVVVPRARALAECRAQGEAKTQRFSFLRDAQSPRAEQHRQDVQDERSRQYADFVFRSDEMNKLDFAIQAIAEKNGLSSFSARHGGAVSVPESLKLKQVAQRELLLSFTGGFPGFLHFVNELERHQPVVFVNQFTVRSAPGKEAGLACDVECSVLYQNAGK